MSNIIGISRLRDWHMKETTALLRRTFNISAQDVRKSMRRAADEMAPPAVFVATINGRVVGTVQCHYYEPGFSAVAWLAVDEACRKNGIGHLLMQQAEFDIAHAALPRRDAAVLLKDGTKKNNPASRFYENMGYVHEAPGVMHDGLPILTKRLKNRPFRVSIRHAF